MSGLSETDMGAIAAAVRILNEAGYVVEKTNHTKPGDQGIEFKLQCAVDVRTPGTWDQIQAVKGAAMDAPEFDMGGNEIDEMPDDE